MSEVGNRTGALLPTPMEAWEHNNMNGRRLLPSPGPKKVCQLIATYDSRLYVIFILHNMEFLRSLLRVIWT